MGIDEIWADNVSQVIEDKMPDFEYIAAPLVHNVSITTFFKDPEKVAISRVRKLAKKRNYNTIFFINSDYLGTKDNLTLRSCKLKTVLYRRVLKSSKVLEDTSIQE